MRVLISITTFALLFAVHCCAISVARADDTHCANGATTDTEDRCRLIHHYNSVDGAPDGRIMTNLHVDKADTVRSMALIIAISEYPEMGGKLVAAENDLKHLEKLFVEDQKFDEVVVLKNDDANRDNIDYFLRIYFVRKGEQFHGRSRLVVAYSGHGVELRDSTTSALVLSHAKNTFDPATLLPLRDLGSAFQRLAETNFHVLVLLNACYGGGVFSMAPAGGNEAISDQPGAHGLTAGPSDDVVWSLGGIDDGSIFFDTLIKGITSGDADKTNMTVLQGDGSLRQRGGVVRLAPLLIYLTDKVNELNDDPPPSIPKGKKIAAPWIGSVEPPGKVALGGFFFLSPVILAPGVEKAILNVPPGAASSVPGHPELKVFNPPDVYGVRGIDVSSNNKGIDWGAVRSSSIQFAYIRATGQRVKDTSFSRNWDGAGKAGLRRGAYHVFSFCEDPGRQFERIIAAVPRDDGALPLAVDLEFFGRPVAVRTVENACAMRSPEQIRGALLDLLHRLAQYYGKLPVLYGASSAFEQLLDQRFKQYSIWLASFRKSEPRKTVRLGLSGETAWTIWQHSESGRVAGINDLVDQNVFFGTEEQFQIFAKGFQNLALEIAIGPSNAR
jgi:GH25 family lysozyme M1 (1,4-beta-N-acetylmuramidase)